MFLCLFFLDEMHAQFFKIYERKTVDTASPLILRKIYDDDDDDTAAVILKHFWENRKTNNFENAKYLQYESYININIALNNLSPAFKQSVFVKPFVHFVDSVTKIYGENSHVVLPFLVSENVSEIYQTSNPHHRKEVVKATKVEGYVIDNTSVLQNYVGGYYQRYNFYDNYLYVFDRNIESPLADACMNFYDIYAVDTTVFVNGEECYELHFRPKNIHDFAFFGRMWINKRDYALNAVAAEVRRQSNVNFIERLVIQQNYVQIEGGFWAPQRTIVSIDAFLPQKMITGVVGRFYVENSDFKTTNPLKPSFYRERRVFEDSSLLKTDAFWDAKRVQYHTDSVNFDLVYSTIDTIRKSRWIRTVRNFFDYGMDGFYPVGKYVGIGHWAYSIGYNDVEELRLQLTLKTTPNFSRKLFLQSRIAYGFGDERWKYNFEGEYMLNRRRWEMIGAKYSFDTRRLGINQNLVEDDAYMNIFVAIAQQFAHIEQMGYSQNARLWYKRDFWQGFDHTITLDWKNFDPQGAFVFAYYDKNNDIRTKYTISAVNYRISYGPRRMFIERYSERSEAAAFSGGKVTFYLGLGLPDVLESNFSFQRVGLEFEKMFRFGGVGRTKFNASATKIFGQVPYTDAIVFQGNETMFESELSYSSMNFFEFTSDQSIELYAKHYFDGLLFNRIPGFNRLHWREIVGARMVFSSLSDKNNFRTTDNPDGLLPQTYNNQPLTSFQTMTFSEPYAEIFYGIENILGLFRVVMTHRLTYLDSPGIQSLFGVPGMSLKFGISVKL